jgi:tetratricopeptide (TPR) repeat protein
MSGNCVAAITNFTNYRERFPQGSFIINANFYLADCYLRTGNLDEAMRGFEFVLDQPRNMFTEQALMSASAIYFNKENYQLALESYQRLESEAQIASNIRDARIGIMRSYYQLNNYNQSVEAAQRILENRDLPIENIREAQFILAQSYRYVGNMTAALSEYKKLSTEVSSAEGAESKYHVIDILLQQHNYNEAEAQVFDFGRMGTPHQYWMAKSFILLSDVYVAKRDDFQAVSTLQSVIENYDITNDGIIELATSKKRIIESRTNTDRSAPTRDLEIRIE